MNPVRERERDAFVRHIDEADERGRRALHDLAADRERREEPREHEVHDEQRADAAPLDFLAPLREQHAEREEDDDAQDVDDEIHG